MQMASMPSATSEPNGCMAQDWGKSPRIAIAIDRVIPQDGHETPVSSCTGHGISPFDGLRIINRVSRAKAVPPTQCILTVFGHFTGRAPLQQCDSTD